MNKSKILIIEVIVSSMLGFPNIQNIFSEEIIRIASLNLSTMMIILASLIKISLVFASIAWIIQLGNNIEFTYNMHETETFNNYLAELLAIGLVTFFAMLLLFNITNI